MGRNYAGILGSLAMAVVLGRGVMDSAGIEGTLSVSIIALVVFALIGSVLGQIAQTTVDESVRQKIELELASASAASNGIPTRTR
jgi:predicted lipid-binding transport protein (Tim44 family)